VPSLVAPEQEGVRTESCLNGGRNFTTGPEKNVLTINSLAAGAREEEEEAKEEQEPPSEKAEKV
jgi:hypothetical protein